MGFGRNFGLIFIIFLKKNVLFSQNVFYTQKKEKLQNIKTNKYTN